MSPEQTRYRRRRKVATWLVFAVVAVALVAGGRDLLLRSPRFMLQTVTVTGAAALPVPAIRAASGLRAGVPLLSADLDGAQARVAAIPSVASVEALRHWPGTVELHVTERIPVALASSPNGLRLVDYTGMAYRQAGAKTPALPRLAAARVAPNDPATEAGLAVLAALPTPVRSQLQVVEASGPRAVTLRLAGGKQVRWGDAEESDRKAAVLAVLLSQPASIYDVSSPELPTVRR
jgi:cell division protein FtsQ